MATEEHAGPEPGIAEQCAEHPSSTPSAADSPAADVEALRAQIEALQQELAAAREQELRALAEGQNLRRRAEREVEAAHKFALEKFVAALLPVVDNLERALAAIDRDDPKSRALGEGVELTHKALLDALRQHQVEVIDPSGASFDPELHQAVATVPHPELPANRVVEVLQPGYTLNRRLVRPAMVVVSQGVPAGAEA
ncbi:MAG: nucleotide exchange factor GrpE [Pseudomonadota bacterium]